MRKVKNVVYVIEFENGIKIGRAKELFNRIFTYTAPWCQSIKKVYYVQTPFPTYVESKLRRSLIKEFNHPWSNEFIVNGDINKILNILERVKRGRPDGVMSAGHFTYEIKSLNFNEPEIKARWYK